MKIEIVDIMETVGLALMVVLAGCLIYCMLAGDNDDRPDWADDTASQLDEKGGRIHYYGDAIRDSGATPVFSVVVTVDQDVYANAQGIIIKNDQGMIQIPYERVYAIYPTGGLT